MKQDIFEQVGKRTPYSTPDGFFEASEKQIKTALLTEHRAAMSDRVQTKTHRTSFNRKLYWSFGIAAAVALVVGIFGIVRYAVPTTAPSDSPVYSQTYDASDDWGDFADADIFLDNMTW